MRTKKDIEQDIELYEAAIVNSLKFIESYRFQIHGIEQEILSEVNHINNMRNHLDSLRTALDDFNQNTH